VTAGTEAQFLSPLTVTHLSLPLEIIETLYDLGIKTIGQLAAFPPNEITQRFGAEVLALARLARGDDPAAFLPEPVPTDLSHRLALEYAVFFTDALCAHLEQVISPFLASLSVAGQGCQTLIVDLGCEDHTVKTIPVACDRPTASASVFLRQFRTALERCRLPGGVIDIVVRVPAVMTLSGEQTEWNTTLMAASYKQETFPAELEQCGVYAATPQRRLLPEQGATFVPLRTAVKYASAVVGDSPAVGYPPYALRSVGGLRLLTPPEKVSAVMQAGALHSIRRIGGVVESVRRQHGPWRLSGGWWQTAFDRLYYEVETAGQRVFLLFFDRLSAQWFIQGVFD
ncbi:MAG TPA: hypothetical protein VN285_04425, partial [Candidatus Deferrimicrobium sp.]|nr:hypothetical protein [Candidatus Deferrimicrobium sp.]